MRALIATLGLAVTSIAAPAAASTDDLAAYMKARVADADGAVDLAAADYARAFAGAPDDAAVAIRAYREAVQAGDVGLADRAAAALSAKGVAPADAGLLSFAKAARAHDEAAAQRAIGALGSGQLRILAVPLAAWTTLEAGENDPLAPLALVRDDKVAKRFAEETRALILIAQGKIADGLAALLPLLGNDQAAQDNRIAAARLLVGQNRRDEARALLVGNAPAIAALREDMGKGTRAGMAFGASWLFTRVASDLALGEPGPLSFTLAQAALRADPGNDRARLLLAGALAKDGATDQALATLDQVDRRGIYAEAAATGRIQILASAGREADALAVAAAATRQDADSADLQRLADLYVRLDRPADAVPLYAKLVERAGARADWSDWLQYGAALDQSGDWARARPALEKAVALGREQPLALNYLGYSLIEHRERMDYAQKLLERAMRLRPDDPAITDSLGWALYMRGQVTRAMPLIERAAAADPANAEIGEHLGDVYWRAGRRYEARYAWTAARAVAMPEHAERLAGKIANGL